MGNRWRNWSYFTLSKFSFSVFIAHTLTCWKSGTDINTIRSENCKWQSTKSKWFEWPLCSSQSETRAITRIVFSYFSTFTWKTSLSFQARSKQWIFLDFVGASDSAAVFDGISLIGDTRVSEWLEVSKAKLLFNIHLDFVVSYLQRSYCRCCVGILR